MRLFLRCDKLWHTEQLGRGGIWQIGEDFVVDGAFSLKEGRVHA